MEITLEKIELVRDKTGVTYKEAKEALEKTDGSVVDAIIEIESKVNIDSSGKASGYASTVTEKIKEAIQKGNVSKIVIRKGDEIILNLPVNLGIVGTVLAPWAVIFAAIAAIGTKCEIHLVKDDGEIINVSERASETFDSAVVKGSIIKDEVVDKGGDAIGIVKDKASDVLDKASDALDRVKTRSRRRSSDDWYHGSGADSYDDDMSFSTMNREYDDDEEKNDSCGCSDDSEFNDLCGCGTASDESKSSQTSNESDPAFFDLDWVKQAGGRAGNEDAEDSSEKISDTIKDKAEDLKDTIEEKTEGFADSASDKFNLFKERLDEKAEAFGKGSSDIDDKTEEHINNASESFSKGLNKVSDSFENKSDSLGDAAEDAKESLGEKLFDVKEAVEDKVEDVTDSIKDKVDEVSERAEEIADDTQKAAEDINDKAENEKEKKKSDLFKLFKF